MYHFIMVLIFQEIKRAFKGYVEAYKVEIINNKSLSDSLSVSKNSIKNLFDELLREKRGFKYIISVKITLKKRINDNEFNISSFEEILNLLDIWINEGSRWAID